MLVCVKKGFVVGFCTRKNEACLDCGMDIHNLRFVKLPYESFDYQINPKKLGDGTDIC